MSRSRINKSVIVSILLISVLGAIIFFPLNLKSGKTCLYHRMFGGDEENLPGHVPYMERAHIMLSRYLTPFGYMWWLSLAILAVSIYYLKSSKINSKKEHV